MPTARARASSRTARSPCSAAETARTCRTARRICDHLVEQVTPTSTWGRRFITTPLASRQNGDTFRIVAATDDTEVRIDGDVVATLDAGHVHEQILTASSVIESTEPVLVAQFANGSTFSGNPGDPFMMIVPPYEQFLNAYTVTTPATGFVQSYVNVVAPGDGSGITLDGTLIPTSEFAAVGDSGYSAAAIAVEPGTHRLSAARPFGLAIYGFNNDDSYGYTGGLSLSQVATGDRGRPRHRRRRRRSSVRRRASPARRRTPTTRRWSACGWTSR